MDNRLSIFISAMPVASVESFSNDSDERTATSTAKKQQLRPHESDIIEPDIIWHESTLRPPETSESAHRNRIFFKPLSGVV